MGSQPGCGGSNPFNPHRAAELSRHHPKHRCSHSPEGCFARATYNRGRRTTVITAEKHWPARCYFTCECEAHQFCKELELKDACASIHEPLRNMSVHIAPLSVDEEDST